MENRHAIPGEAARDDLARPPMRALECGPGHSDLGCEGMERVVRIAEVPRLHGRPLEQDLAAAREALQIALGPREHLFGSGRQAVLAELTKAAGENRPVWQNTERS